MYFLIFISVCPVSVCVCSRPSEYKTPLITLRTWGWPQSSAFWRNWSQVLFCWKIAWSPSGRARNSWGSVIVGVCWVVHAVAGESFHDLHWALSCTPDLILLAFSKVTAALKMKCKPESCVFLLSPLLRSSNCVWLFIVTKTYMHGQYQSHNVDNGFGM